MFWTFYLYSIILEIITICGFCYKVYKRSLVDEELEEYLHSDKNKTTPEQKATALCMCILPFINLFVSLMFGATIFNDELFDFMIDFTIHR